MVKREMTLAIGDRRSGASHCALVDGMTLIELLVVLGITAAIVGMSVPAMTRYSGQVRLKTTVRQMAGFLSLARSLSIGSQAGHTVIIDTEHKQMTVVDNGSGETLDQKFRLPQGIDIEAVAGGEALTPPEIAFQPSGSLRGRTVLLILKDKPKTITITVSSMTGAVTVE